MSSEKSVSGSLRHSDTERGSYGKNAPIRYVPEQDPVADTLSEQTVTSNTVKLPGGTKTSIQVWAGRGNNESFLDFVISTCGLVKRLGLWKELDEADGLLEEAKAALKTAERNLKSATKV